MPKRSRLSRNDKPRIGKWARLKEALRREPLGSDVLAGLGFGTSAVGAVFPATGGWVMIPAGAIIGGGGLALYRSEKAEIARKLEAERKVAGMGKRERKAFMEREFRKRFGVSSAEAKKVVWKEPKG